MDYTKPIKLKDFVSDFNKSIEFKKKYNNEGIGHEDNFYQNIIHKIFNDIIYGKFKFRFGLNDDDLIELSKLTINYYSPTSSIIDILISLIPLSRQDISKRKLKAINIPKFYDKVEHIQTTIRQSEYIDVLKGEISNQINITNNYINNILEIIQGLFVNIDFKYKNLNETENYLIHLERLLSIYLGEYRKIFNISESRDFFNSVYQFNLSKKSVIKFIDNLENASDDIKKYAQYQRTLKQSPHYIFCSKYIYWIFEILHILFNWQKLVNTINSFILTMPQQNNQKAKARQTEELKNNSKNENDLGISNELRISNTLLVKARKKLKSQGMTEIELKDHIDNCRKKNGKVNLTKLGRALGIHHTTTRNWIENHGLLNYAKIE